MSERKAVLSTVIAATVVVAAGLAAIYVLGNRVGNNVTPAVTPELSRPNEIAAATPDQAAGCEAAPAAAAKLDPLARGSLVAFRVASNPVSLRHLSFNRPDGTPVTVADFAGKTVLLNLWAIWCPPCRREMPALDRLAGAMEGEDFTVVAVASDNRNGPELSQAFLDEVGVQHLPLYVDQSAQILSDIQRIGAFGGLPTTFLIDPQGCFLGILQGEAEWDSPAAVALVTAAE